MNSYTVTVERGDGVWLAYCEGIAYTQARHLREVEPMIREAVSLMQDVPETQVNLDIIWPADILTSVDLWNRAEAAALEAQQSRRRAATSLRRRGLPYRDVGAILGISHQRAQQLVEDAAPE